MGAPDGSRLGKALADLFANAQVNTRTVLTPVELAAQARARATQMEEWERELAPYWQDILGWLHDDETLTPEQRAIIAPLVKPTHQTDFILSILAVLGIAIVGLPAAASGIANGLTQRSMAKFAQNPVPIDGLVSGLVSGRFDMGFVAEQAKWQGFKPGEISKMVDAARPAIPPTDALELNRRGILSDGQAENWIADAGYDHPQTQLLMRLRERLPDLGLVISALTQSQLSDADARAFMQKQGIDLANFNWIKETAGQSPGVDLVLELLNKGLISEDEARTAVLESPIKNKYLDAMMKARYRIPPMEQTISMVRRGAYTAAEAAHNLSRLGYFPEDIKKLIDWATQEKVATPRDLTAGQIVDNYEVGLIDRPTAKTMLVNLRYDDSEADMYLNLADAKKARAKLDRAISKVHQRYIAWKISDVEASNALDKLNVPMALKDELFDIWNVEREISTKELTPAQLIKGFTLGLLDQAKLKERLMGIGYSSDDADFYMNISGIGLPEEAGA